MVKTYKAFTKALHDNMFRLKGKFDCANEYIRRSLTSTEFMNLPKVRADRLFPYYFKHSEENSVKGIVEYSAVLPPNPIDGTPTRRVTCVNVKRHGTLVQHIQDRTVVYLGGDHSDLHSSMENTARSFSDSQDCKYVQYNSPTTVAGPGAFEEEDLYISSPFPDTWRGTEDGLNVGIAKLKTGHFLYWATDCSPAPGQQLSALPLRDVPKCAFLGDRGIRFQSWPIFVNDEPVNHFEIFEGAWVMRGHHLVQEAQEGAYPAGVLDRLRGGFFRGCGKEVMPSLSCILSLIMKAKQSVEQYGGKMFGFDETPDGIIQCDIQSLSAHVRVPVDALLAFISTYSSSYMLFRGTVDFLRRRDMEGIFEITKPLPVGRWMRGRVLDTGTGLLYYVPARKYFEVECKDGVSWLSEYNGPGTAVRKELKLAPLITGPRCA